VGERSSGRSERARQTLLCRRLEPDAKTIPAGLTSRWRRPVCRRTRQRDSGAAWVPPSRTGRLSAWPRISRHRRTRSSVHAARR